VKCSTLLAAVASGWVSAVLCSAAPQLAGDAALATKREDMVKHQIEARGVKDRLVLKAMRKVPRHLLCPVKTRHLAYADTPLPIREGQTISQPYIVALMTELLQLKGGEKVLEVGTGSGYQAAVLAEIVEDVYTIEIIAALANRAREDLNKLGYTNIRVKCGDGFVGWQEHAPYDGIVVTCAPERVPQSLLDQLKVGGRLVIPLGPQWRWQWLKVFTRKADGFDQEQIAEVRFVPMLGKSQKMSGGNIEP